MRRFPKKYWTYALFFAAGSLVSGGAVFAATGTYVQALYQSANLYVPNNSYNTYTDQLTYNGVSYINTNSLLNALNDAGVYSYWNGQTLTINGVTNYTSSSTYYPYTTVTSSVASTNPTTYTYVPNSQSVSLFDFPQFAAGTGDQPGSTAIYSSFVDNLGNRYLEPAMCWNVSSSSGTTSSSTTNVTLGNTLGQPYGSELLNQHVNYQSFQDTSGSTGTFSKIYNLNGNYNSLTFTLSPSAYYNSMPVNSNIGSLEIVNTATGTDLFNYSNFSTNITAPVSYTVPLSGVNQVEVIFKTNGLGLINPLLIK